MMLQTLATKTIVVTARTDGTQTEATLLVCPHCDGEQWVAYLVEGKRLHFQCLQCAHTYCGHEGACDPRNDESE